MIPIIRQKAPNIAKQYICPECDIVLSAGETLPGGLGKTLKWNCCPMCGEEIEWEKAVPVKWEPLNCSVCGNRLIWNRMGMVFASELYIGTDVCMDCQIEHCTTTNCLGCKQEQWSDCQHRRLKETALKEKEGNQNG